MWLASNVGICARKSKACICLVMVLSHASNFLRHGATLHTRGTKISQLSRPPLWVLPRWIWGNKTAAPYWRNRPRANSDTSVPVSWQSLVSWQGNVYHPNPHRRTSRHSKSQGAQLGGPLGSRLGLGFGRYEVLEGRPSQCVAPFLVIWCWVGLCCTCDDSL